MDRLDAIRIFVRVVERGSFSAAARDAGIGQSAVSKQVKALEVQFGAQLLLRSSRNLRVTEAGDRFYRSALHMLETYAEMEARIGEGQAAPSGLLRIAVAPVFGRFYIIPQLPAFFSQFPGVRVELISSERHINMIEDGVDLAIRHGELSDSAMTAVGRKPVHHRGRPRLSQPSRYAARRARACRSRLHRLPWPRCHPSLEHPFSGRFTLRASSRRQFRTNDGEQVRAALFAGLGIAHLPAWLVMPELASGQLRIVLPDHQPVVEPISAVFAAGRRPVTRMRIFMDFLDASLRPQFGS
jgi:LysR family transcriptional regulator for bpeEF and oprC